MGKLPIASGATLLHVGSSTREFRETIQPHIQSNLFTPLERRGVRVVHMDMKRDDGVDLECDITDYVSVTRNVPDRYDIVLCANLLEHVTVRDRVVANVRRLVRPGGYLVVTVPHHYRRHSDPIDTMFRPAPEELVRLFCADYPLLTPVTSVDISIADKSYYQERRSPIPFWGRRELLRYRIPAWRWKQSCVLFRHA